MDSVMGVAKSVTILPIAVPAFFMEVLTLLAALVAVFMTDVAILLALFMADVAILFMATVGALINDVLGSLGAVFVGSFGELLLLGAVLLGIFAFMFPIRFILLDETIDCYKNFIPYNYHILYIIILYTVFYRTISSTHIDIISLIRRRAYTACIR